MGVPLPSNNPGVANDRDGCEYDAAGDPSMFAAVDRMGPALRAQSPADPYERIRVEACIRRFPPLAWFLRKDHEGSFRSGLSSERIWHCQNL